MGQKTNNNLFNIISHGLLALCLFGPLQGLATEPSAITAEELTQLVSSINQQMEEQYISAEHARKMSALLNSRLQQGVYDRLTHPEALSEALTQDLRSINQDEHIRVTFDPTRIAAQRQKSNSKHEMTATAEDLRRLQRKNYGFEQVTILPGNVGYINLTGSHDPKYSADTAVAAMNTLANSDAIIFDLRQNGGGREQMFQLLASYLFDEEPVLLNNMYQRSQDQYFQTWTLPHVAGKRRPDVDVYILTSDYTFSAAEAFSYSLKHLKRAILVGETTGGGAHAGSPGIVSERFTLWLPRFEIVHPVTGTDWEGTGVIPHIQVDPEQALDTAYRTALETLITKNPEEAAINQWHLDSINARHHTPSVSMKLLNQYQGQYAKHRTLQLKDQALYYQSENGGLRKLSPLSDTLFEVEGIRYFRIKVIIKNGAVAGIQGKYDDGRSIDYPRLEV